MKHAKTSLSTEMCAGAIISVVQYLAPLRYIKFKFRLLTESLHGRGVCESPLASSGTSMMLVYRQTVQEKQQLRYTECTPSKLCHDIPL
jgi:hypothetical protein